MTILFFMILILLALPLWGLLVLRIWKISPPGTRATFLAFFPVYYWGYQHWDDRELALRPLLIANLAGFIITLLIGLMAFGDVFSSRHEEERARARVNIVRGVDMARWCKENNDASYDPVLGTCVEPTKAEALAQFQDSDIFGRLTKHLIKHRLQGEFDLSKTATSLKQAASPEIIQTAPYYFLPMSMSQPPVTVLVCVSESACVKYEEEAKERGMPGLVRNHNLLLMLPAETAGVGEDARISRFREVFLKFHPA